MTDTTKSRVVYIWDQTLNKQGSEKSPQDRDAVNLSGLNYGVEYSNSNINGELNKSTSGFVREKDVFGHGSHTAGSASGNGAASNGKYAGMAPDADLLIIKAGDSTFSNNSIIDGLTYAAAISKQLSEPIVVNMSFGGLEGPNDGTDALDEVVDSFVNGGAGRAVCAAAGNENGTNAHITGSIANSAAVNFSFSVPTYTPVMGVNNNFFGFDLWFSTNGAVSSKVTSPNNKIVNSTSAGNASVETTDGTVYVYDQVYTENNNREVYLYVSNGSNHNPAVGTWNLTVTNNSQNSMIYHGWLFDSSIGASLVNGDSKYCIDSPGSASTVITSGAFATKWRWEDASLQSLSYVGTDGSDNICSFSSVGPRRDGMQKPDLSSPGEAVVSVKSSTAVNISASWVMPGNRYMIEQGTSMSSAVTSGAVALLFQQNSGLNAAQIKSYLTGSSSSDSYTGSLPNPQWGYGKMNVFNAMANLVNQIQKNYSIFAYDQWGSDAYTNVSPNQPIAVRFSPASSGQVTGVMFHSYVTNNISGPLYFEVWSDSNGLPGTKIGNTVNLNSSNITLFSWNYVDLTGTKVKVTGGKDYQIVVYFTSGNATGFFVDNSSPLLNLRSSRNNNDGNGWGIKSNYNFRIRPIIVADQTATSVKQSASLPDHFELFNNYPNPFNPSTIISYQIPSTSKVQLKIYDILGREVAVLVNKEQQMGIYKINFNSQLSSDGRALSSGVYFYQLHAGNYINTKKMLLIK